MSKENKDSIEQFFRKAVNKHDLQFRESDWQKMEKMLDQSPEQRKAILIRNRKRIVYSIVGATGLLIGIYFFSWKSSENTSGAIATELTEQKQAAEDPKALGQNHLHDNPSASLLFQSESETKETEQQDLTKIPEPENTESEKPKVRFEKEKTESKIQNRNFPPVSLAQINKIDNGIPSSEEVNRSETVTPERSALQDPKEIAALSEKKSEQPGLSQSQAKEARNASREPGIVKSDSVHKDIAEEIDSPDEIQNELSDLEEKNKRSGQRPKWSIALIIAPDFSSIGMGKFSTPGKSYGILGSYRFLNRFQVSTGVILSNKKYSGYGSEYQPPEGYWMYYTNGIVPEEVDGACNVLEVPLIVQYDVYNAPKGRYFLSGGFSSYWMLSESYWYKFKNPNPGAVESWDAKTSSSYLFGIGSVSVGYERFLSKRLAVGVEPYLKIPLTGVGWCDIDLFTTGANVSVRYSLPVR